MYLLQRKYGDTAGSYQMGSSFGRCFGHGGFSAALFRNPSPSVLMFFLSAENPAYPHPALVRVSGRDTDPVEQDGSRSGRAFRLFHCRNACRGRYFRDPSHRILPVLLSATDRFNRIFRVFDPSLESAPFQCACISLYQMCLCRASLCHYLFSGENRPPFME